jgi:hypothetical protein
VCLLLNDLGIVVLVFYLLFVLLPLPLQLMHFLLVLLAQPLQVQLETGDGELQLAFKSQQALAFPLVLSQVFLKLGYVHLILHLALSFVVLAVSQLLLELLNVVSLLVQLTLAELMQPLVLAPHQLEVPLELLGSLTQF